MLKLKNTILKEPIGNDAIAADVKLNENCYTLLVRYIDNNFPDTP